MKYPNIIYMNERWIKEINETQAYYTKTGYVPARALGFASFWTRLRAAWLVFTGKADALIWPCDQ